MRHVLRCTLFLVPLLAWPTASSGQEDPSLFGRSLAAEFNKQFDDQEVSFRFKSKTVQVDISAEEVGDGAIARTAGKHAIGVKKKVTELTGNKSIPQPPSFHRAVIDPDGSYTRIEYEPSGTLQSAKSIRIVGVGKVNSPIPVYHAYYRSAGLEWLICMGWVGLGVTELTSVDAILSPSGVVHDVGSRQIRYNAACGRVTVGYEPVNNKNRLKSVAVSQKPEDVLTVARFPNVGVKLSDCKRGPGFPTLETGLDGVNFTLTVSYDPNGRMGQLEYSESAKAGTQETSRRVWITLGGSRPTDTDDIVRRYVTPIPDGTKAAIIDDQVGYQWQKGELVKDIDQAAVDTANRSIFRNAPARNILIAAAVVCAVAVLVAYYYLRKKRGA